MSISLEHQETIVFKAIQIYLQGNKTFSMNDILSHLTYRFAKGSINININGIKKILISLLDKKLIVEGSKFTKNDVLLNIKRKKIYDFILRNPGMYFNQIVKNTKIHNFLVFWHLETLLKFNFIKSERINGHMVYFGPNISFEEVRKIYYLSKEKSKKIIDYLRINDIGVTKTHLSKQLNIHHNTISRYLIFLEEFNVILKVKKDNNIIYFLNDG